MNCHICQQPLTDSTRRFMGLGEVHVSCFDTWRTTPAKEIGVSKSRSEPVSEPVSNEPIRVGEPAGAFLAAEGVAGNGFPGPDRIPDNSNAGGAKPAKGKRETDPM